MRINLLRLKEEIIKNFKSDEKILNSMKSGNWNWLYPDQAIIHDNVGKVMKIEIFDIMPFFTEREFNKVKFYIRVLIETNAPDKLITLSFHMSDIYYE